MRFTVLQRHIDAGVPGDEYQCPIALAVTEELDLPEGTAEVSGYEIYTGDNFYAVPSLLNGIISDYDDGGKMYPFSFIL